jgi:hypothetical protein
MDHCRPGTFVGLALAFFASGAGTALAMQPAGAPANQVSPPAERWASHPYKAALGAVANYQSCGVRARRAMVNPPTAALRSLEAAALAKGLGPTLERLRREYEALMAVSDVMACAGGPVRALAEARRALAAFRAWVEAQPGR